MLQEDKTGPRKTVYLSRLTACLWRFASGPLTHSSMIPKPWCHQPWLNATQSPTLHDLLWDQTAGGALTPPCHRAVLSDFWKEPARHHQFLKHLFFFLAQDSLSLTCHWKKWLHNHYYLRYSSRKHNLPFIFIIIVVVIIYLERQGKGMERALHLTDSLPEGR